MYPSTEITPISAQSALSLASAAITDRASKRDPAAGERSMPACILIFKAITGIELTEKQGWLFMVALKLARDKCNQGEPDPDDFIDAIAYLALTIETITS